MTDSSFSTRPKDYAPIGKALHWISALLVLGSVAFSVGSIVVASVAQARAVR